MHSDPETSTAQSPGATRPLKVLMVEDARLEALFVLRALRQGGFEPTAHRVYKLDELEQALQEQAWQLILCDYVLPGFTALEVLEVLGRAAPDVPCIVVSGMVGEEVAVQCMRAGARDLVLKDRMDRLVPAVERELEQAQVRRDQHRAREAMQISHQFLLLANRHTHLPSLLADWVNVLQQATSLNAVGVRLRQPDGKLVMPAQVGFSDRFMGQEGVLEPGHERCFCARMVEGESDLLPLQATGDGGCWTADLTGALAQGSGTCAGLRGGCIEDGVESLALVPIMIGDHVAGLIIATDPRAGVIDAHQVALLEQLAVQLGTAVSRTRALEQLEEQERLYRTMVEFSPDAVLVADAAGLITAANQRAALVFGYDKPEQLHGEPLKQLMASQDRPPDDPDLQQLLLETNGRGAELYQRRRDGSVFPAEVHATVLRTNGDTAGIIASVRDITERHQTQAQAAQTDRLANVGLLAAGVAHEINNPLTYVLHNVDWLARQLRKQASSAVLDDQRLDEQDKTAALTEMIKVAGETREGATRVRDIVRDLGTFSRGGDERLVPVNVNDVLEVACSMARTTIEGKAQLELELGEVAPVMADTGSLAQVLLNLLINAAQAIDQGGVEDNTVKARTWCEDDEVLVCIEDTGAGIAPEHLERLFKPFFTTKEPGLGTGLGLSICHNLVTRFEGRLEVQSEPGKGSSFVVHLPAKQSASVKPRRPMRTTGNEPAVGPRARVLIIDDEPRIVSSLLRLLKAHELVVARSGEEGRQLLKQDCEFDVILCDLMMPQLTGMELHAWIMKHDPDLAQRVVFITGGANTQPAKDFLEQVPNRVLTKPFDVPELRQVIEEMVGSD